MEKEIEYVNVILKSEILKGLPDSRDEVHVHLYTYVTFRDEMTMNNGLIFKCEHVVTYTRI